jgi:hypothetical protein
VGPASLIPVLFLKKPANDRTHLRFNRGGRIAIQIDWMNS